ncbi:hypothetical protein GCM10009610_50720 [Pseudonocardia xinjiangensis]
MRHRTSATISRTVATSQIRTPATARSILIATAMGQEPLRRCSDPFDGIAAGRAR